MIPTITIHADTSHLDLALEKMERLLRLTQQYHAANHYAQQQGLPLGTGALALSAAAIGQPLTRRSLLGLGWRRR